MSEGDIQNGMVPERYCCGKIKEIEHITKKELLKKIESGAYSVNLVN